VEKVNRGEGRIEKSYVKTMFEVASTADDVLVDGVVEPIAVEGFPRKCERLVEAGASEKL